MKVGIGYYSDYLDFSHLMLYRAVTYLNLDLYEQNILPFLKER